MSYKSGFVAIIGRPNVGKSTLLNKIMGEKISIMSSKPQTTRNNIRAIYTEEDYQIIFTDTPGIHKPKTKLGEFMVSSASSTVGDADVCLFLIEASTRGDIPPGDEDILEQLKSTSTPVILVINKIDLIKRDALLGQITEYSKEMNFAAVIPISATKGDECKQWLMRC